MNALKSGINSIVAVILVISIGAFGIVTIQWQPLWLVLRSMMLAGLGEPTPGLSIEGDPGRVKCDPETLKCRWED